MLFKYCTFITSPPYFHSQVVHNIRTMTNAFSVLGQDKTYTVRPNQW